MSLALFELALVGVPVCKNIGTVTVLQALLPLTLIAISIFPPLYPVPFSLAVTPLPDVAIPVLCGPHAVPMLQAHVPFAIVDLPATSDSSDAADTTMRPLVHTLAMRLALFERSEVGVARGVTLEASPVPQVIVKIPFILTTVRVTHNSETMADCFTLVTSFGGHLADIN